MHVSTILSGPAAAIIPGVTPAVYGLVLPETRAMVRRLWAEQPEMLYECAYDDVQDAAHGVFLDRWRAWVVASVGGLDGFTHSYVTNGSSEAIRETVWELAAAAKEAGTTPYLHVFAGEYEGYAAYARAARITVVVHDRTRWRDELSSPFPAGMHRWYLSQPSAIDGNQWAEFSEFVTASAPRGVELAIDLAYVGATPKLQTMDLALPHIRYAFFSLSKVFGVFYHRIGGILSRAPLLGLEGNKWFKNMFSLYLGVALLEDTATPTTLPAKYQQAQDEACRALRARHGIPFTPSDVILLATSPSGDYPSKFRRASGYRWCLTPTIDELLVANHA